MLGKGERKLTERQQKKWAYWRWRCCSLVISPFLISTYILLYFAMALICAWLNVHFPYQVSVYMSLKKGLFLALILSDLLLTGTKLELKKG